LHKAAKEKSRGIFSLLFLGSESVKLPTLARRNGGSGGLHGFRGFARFGTLDGFGENLAVPRPVRDSLMPVEHHPPRFKGEAVMFTEVIRRVTRHRA
jgi:hypothetical protein